MGNANKQDAEYSTVAGRFYSGPTVITIGAGANVASPSLTAGLYRVCSNALVHIRQASSNAIAVTASNGHPIVASLPEHFAVGGDGDDFVVCFSAAGGTAWLSRR